MRMTATIKKIIKDKGFGFITPDAGMMKSFFTVRNEPRKYILKICAKAMKLNS